MAGVRIVHVFEGWNSDSLSCFSPTDEYASFDVYVGVKEWRQAIKSGWIVELVAIACFR